MAMAEVYSQAEPTCALSYVALDSIQSQQLDWLLVLFVVFPLETWHVCLG